jgi:ATP-dependent helicase HrpB
MPGALPIDDVVPELRDHLARAGCAVLQAPPGAGKTTRVPLALARESWLGDQRIVMLEPRRLAARAAANYMASLLGEEVGQTVGYRIRLETRVGRSTRIEVVTEGVLTRMLNADPTLDGVGLVIFDEFHERSLHADVALALTLHARRLVRADLRILVMSATLDGGPVAALLGNAPIVTTEGRAFAVEVRYAPLRDPKAKIDVAVAAVARDALATHEGDLLVFLPGAGEIRQVASRLESMTLEPNVSIAPLYGDLSRQAQDLAIAPSPPGRRKVVLATSIAETSLTIEGVRVVVDSGLARVPRFSPRTGMTRLATVRVSRAGAEQRRGRAGRVAPGVCYRLWSRDEDAQLLPFSVPEILEADLAPMALDLAAFGVSDASELAWLDAPPPGSLAAARALLMTLDAIDDPGRLTPMGAAMARIGAHPRLGHMMLRARDDGMGALACDLAALLTERDPLRRGSTAPSEVDLRTRLAVLRDDRTERAGFDRDAVQRVRATAAQWRRALGIGDRSDAVDSCGDVLMLAYPDRIAQRRPGGPSRYLLREGGGVLLPEGDSLGTEPYLVIAETDGRAPDARAYLAAAVSERAIREQLGDQIATAEEVVWDDAAGAVRARRVRRLGAIVLSQESLNTPDPEQIRSVVLDAVRRSALQLLSWTDVARRFRERFAFIHAHDPSWPDVSDAALLATLDEWLGPLLSGVRRRDELARVDVKAALESRFTYRHRASLDELAPTHYEAPSGSRIPIDYSDPLAPVVAVRLQEMFGAVETPRLMRGRVALTIHLLSPASRPVQVTKDLASFWRQGYFDVRRDLRGRYPKHYWPEDPLVAEPTAKKRRPS